MNFPDFAFWSHLVVTVGIEVCCLAVLGFVAQRFLRPAVWQRAAWQIIVICLLLLPASEWTGLGRGTASFLFGQKTNIESVPSSAGAPVKSEVAGHIIVAKFNPASARLPAEVWWPGGLWLIGTALVLARIAMARVFLLMLQCRRGKIADQPLQDRVQHVASCVGLRRKVTLLRMPRAISPMAFGIFRPSIGLPPEFESKLSATEQEAVLAHELAHLAAMDPLWFLLADFASALLWWHPLAWVARRSLHGAAELAADEATTLVPNGPNALAACLVNLGKEMTASGAWGWIGINGGFRSKLGKRVERLTQMPSGANRPLRGWLSAVARWATAFVMVPVIVLLFGAIQSVHAQKEESWQSQFETTWRQSPAGMILLARRDDDTKPNATDEVKKAKFLYELGKCDQAEAILTNVIKDYPSNRSAFYYLDLIKEARYSKQTSDKQVVPIPDATARTNLITKPNVTNEIENAKLLYEQGKYDAAEAVLTLVLRHHPSNQSALYYLDLIKDARYMELPVPYPMWSTNLVHTTMGRQQIMFKLSTITFNEVTYDLPLKDVLVKLRKESQARDPEGIGINFMIDNNVEPAPLVGASGAVVPPTAGTQQQDIGSAVKIRIIPSLTNLKLSEVLEAITKVADKPIRYTVQNSAIVFSPLPPDQFQQLQTKTFGVNPQTVTQHLKELYPNNLTSSKRTSGSGLQIIDGPLRPIEHTAVGGPNAPAHSHVITVKTNESIALQRMINRYLAEAGVNVNPPANVFFNDRLGVILVRATVADMELVQSAIETLNQTPPQIMIEAKFVELTEQENRDLGGAWSLGAISIKDDAASLQIGTNTTTTNQTTASPANPSGIFPGPGTLPARNTTNAANADVINSPTMVGVMTPVEFIKAINVIEQRTGADVLSTPRVVTENGRQAHIGVGEGSENGIALDILPEVGPDGFSISVTAAPRIKLDKQDWQSSASQKLWDGQTMVISGEIPNQPAGARKMALVFITPRIIDSAGNLVHSEDEMAKHPGTPPP